MKKALAAVANLTYYRRNIAWCKLMYLRAIAKNGFKANKTILFYPDLPFSWHLAYQVCHMLGYSITNDPNARFDVAIAFEDTTFRENDRVLDDLSQQRVVLNYRCGNISKERVDQVFLEIFGYGLAIDPRTYQGSYVKKSNLNARHPVEPFEMLDTPTEPEKNFVYQKLIDNRTGEHFVTDIRTFIFGDEISFTLYRKRSARDRFGDNTVTATRVETDMAFSKEEQADILRFCKVFGLDYGELDVLRNNTDGKVYIVDVNNTTAGPQPGIHMNNRDHRLFMANLATAFKQMAGRSDTLYK